MENTWKINDIPSNFLFYDDKYFSGRALTVLDVKYLSTINIENYDDICNELLLRCINLYNVNIEDLCIEDKLYLLFWIRSNSFTKSGFDITSKCPYCNSDIATSCSLEKLNVNYIHPEYFNKCYNYPKSAFNITIKAPKIKDKIINKSNNYDTQILEMASYIDAINNMKLNQLEAYQAINAMDPIEYSRFSKVFNNFKFGIDNILITECPTCKKELKCDLDFSKSIFSDINLLDILEADIKISKYSNRPILDTDPWMEIELRQQIINKLKEKEEEELNNQKQKHTNISHSLSSNIPKMPKLPKF